MNLETLLSDEFVDFSKKVADIHARKKDLKVEYQRVQAEFQKDLANLNQEAHQAQAEFDAWQESKVKGADSFEVIKARKLAELNDQLQRSAEKQS